MTEYHFAERCYTVVGGKMKGGSGNSTAMLLTALSYAQKHPDKEVLLVCADPTTYTLTTFISRLLADNPDYDLPVHFREWEPSQGILTQAAIGYARQVQADVMFIDLGPDRKLVEGIMGLADLVIATSQCTLADVERVWAVNDLADQHSKRLLVVLNRMAVAGKGKARMWRETIEETRIPVSAHEAISHEDYASVIGKLKKYKKKDDEIVVTPVTWFGAYEGVADDVQFSIDTESSEAWLNSLLPDEEGEDTDA